MRRALAAVLLLGTFLLGASAAGAEQADASPLRVRVDLPEGPASIGEAQRVTLIVEEDPEIAAAPAGEIRRVDLLLRLPPGVELRSEGWRAAELPPEERDDGSGPWKLFEREAPASLSAVRQELLREPVELAVTQEGLNWVVTVRVRWAQGDARQRQGFATILATTGDGQAEFHTDPRR